MRRVLLDRRSRPFTDDLDGAEAMHRGWAKANGSKQLPLQSGIRTVRVIHGSQSLLAYGASPEGNIEYLSMGDDSVASRVLTIDDAMFVTTNRNWCDEWSCGRNQSRGSPCSSTCQSAVFPSDFPPGGTATVSGVSWHRRAIDLPRILHAIFILRLYRVNSR